MRVLARPDQSLRCNAARIAKAVVAAYLADEAREDALERALFDASHRLDPDPLHDLATTAESPVTARFHRERLNRFEGRGCRQLGPREWQAETDAIAAQVVSHLSRRYRDFLK